MAGFMAELNKKVIDEFPAAVARSAASSPVRR